MDDTDGDAKRGKTPQIRYDNTHAPVKRSESQRNGVFLKCPQLAQLCRNKEKTYGQVAAAVGLSKGQVSKICSRTSKTTRAKATLIANYLEVPVATLMEGGLTYATRTCWEFNSRKGLTQGEAPLLGSNYAPFQNFMKDGTTGFDAACIAYLWAAFTGDRIHVTPLEGEIDDLGNAIEIEVECSGKSAPPNVAIHPQRMIPRRRRREQRFLCFEARHTGVESDNECVPMIAVRLGDADHFQWRYTSGNRDGFLALQDEYARYYVDLGQTALWKLMPPAYYVDEPDFDLITTLVFEFGFASDHHAEGFSKARIEIKNICLCDSETFVPKVEQGKSREDYELRYEYEALLEWSY